MNKEKVMGLIEQTTGYDFKPYVDGQIAHADADLKECAFGRLTVFIEFYENLREVVVSIKDSENYDFVVSVPIAYDPGLPTRFTTQVHRVLTLAAELVTYQEKP